MTYYVHASAIESRIRLSAEQGTPCLLSVVEQQALLERLHDLYGVIAAIDNLVRLSVDQRSIDPTVADEQLRSVNIITEALFGAPPTRDAQIAHTTTTAAPQVTSATVLDFASYRDRRPSTQDPTPTP